MNEFFKIRDFLVSVAKSDKVQEFQGKSKRIDFINYGDTQLVYVLAVDGRRYTMLIGQPTTKFGVEEKDWGAWVPEPGYHFREFSGMERSVINSSMIAMLIKLFDEKHNLGIGACRLGGGDFVLEKGYEDESITHENILTRLKLIAARELLPMSLDEYVKRLREEFVRRTYYKSEEERDKSILINHKSRAPMSIEEIEEGIELGRKLRREIEKTKIEAGIQPQPFIMLKGIK